MMELGPRLVLPGLRSARGASSPSWRVEQRCAWTGSRYGSVSRLWRITGPPCRSTSLITDSDWDLVYNRIPCAFIREVARSPVNLPPTGVIDYPHSRWAGGPLCLPS